MRNPDYGFRAGAAVACGRENDGRLTARAGAGDANSAAGQIFSACRTARQKIHLSIAGPVFLSVRIPTSYPAVRPIQRAFVG